MTCLTIGFRATLWYTDVSHGKHGKHMFVVCSNSMEHHQEIPAKDSICCGIWVRRTGRYSRANWLNLGEQPKKNHWTPNGNMNGKYHHLSDIQDFVIVILGVGTGRDEMKRNDNKMKGREKAIKQHVMK